MTDVIETEPGLVTSRFRAVQLRVAHGSTVNLAGTVVVPERGWGPDIGLPAPAHQAGPLSPAPGDFVTDQLLREAAPGLAPARSSPLASFPLSPYLRTVAPVVMSDVFALACSALLGLLTVDLLHTLHVSRLPIRAPVSFSWLSTIVMLPLVLAYWYRGLYPGIGLHPVIELCQAMKVNATACLAVIAGLLMSPSSMAWVVFFASAWLASAVLVPLARSLVRRFCAQFNWWGYPTVIISSGSAIRQTVEALRRHPQCGLRPVGFIDADGFAAGTVPGVPHLYPDTSMSAAYALVALPEFSRAALADVLDHYHNYFPHILVLSDWCWGRNLWRDARDCGSGLSGMELRNKLLLPWPQFVKRVVDIALAGAALIAGLPLLAGLALAVRLSSPGAVFFGHTRVGRNGRHFKAWKLRTMRIDAEAMLRELLSNDPDARHEWECDHKLRNDPRVTPIGNFLRRSSLDELPQLWNVLIGEMSLVGPRPIVAAEVNKYGKTYPLYSEVPPGITGLWQVSGRNNTTYEERVQFDSFYVRNWSPWLDLYILARTVSVIITGHGVISASGLIRGNRGRRTLSGVEQ